MRPGFRRHLPAVALALSLHLPAAALAAAAAENYQKLCRNCHGDDGSGNGPVAAVLDKPPQNFTDCAAMAAHSREFLRKIITEGGGAVGESPQMPAFGKNLSAEEIEELTGYVATHFCRDDH